VFVTGTGDFAPAVHLQGQERERTMERRWIATLFFCLTLYPAFDAGFTTALAAPYVVTIENLVPGGLDTGQPMTPPLGVVHDAGYSLFGPGLFATPGLELLAEEGVPTLLATEAMASANVSAVEIGGGPFIGAETITIDGDPGDLFSIVTMLARSNDLITGVHDIVLPANLPFEILTDAYDAGTEMNTGLVEHIPFYGNAMVGPDENQPIAGINAYSVLNDPNHGQIDFRFPPAARVTIERMVVPVEAVTWGEIKSTWLR
jgi:hypothetical protein